MKKIYLAVPYSDPDPAVQEARFLAVNKVAAELMMQGLLVFSPISHTHPIALAGVMPVGWKFWAKYGYTFINDWADEVYVLMLDGWIASVGVSAERKLAREIGKPIHYIDPKTHGIVE